ncbi:hypothetical protein E2542_SST14419 [Spatholobus suberectus]|nr:hypothetical protein E2542_SST14419 [Spatholobus suberectus]
MGIFTWTIFALGSLYPFFTCDVSATSTQLMSNPTQDDICSIVYCGKGTCHRSTELIGFGCDCDSGWNKLNVGPFELPPCIIPNCTVDLKCANGSPPPSFVQPPDGSNRSLGGDCDGLDLGFSTPATSGTAGTFQNFA